MNGLDYMENHLASLLSRKETKQVEFLKGQTPTILFVVKYQTHILKHFFQLKASTWRWMSVGLCYVTRHHEKSELPGGHG